MTKRRRATETDADESNRQCVILGCRKVGEAELGCSAVEEYVMMLHNRRYGLLKNPLS